MIRSTRWVEFVGCLLLAGMLRLSAGTLEFKQGSLALRFDDSNGAWLGLSCAGREIFHGQPGVPPVTFSVGPTNKQVWFEQMGLTRKLVKQARPAPDTLELTVTAGPYELVERYRLLPEQARVDRSLQLVNRGTETLRLRWLAFRTPGLPVTQSGFYRFPISWPPRSYAFSAMQPGRKQRGHGTTAPAISELSPSQSLLWASFTEDAPGIEFTEGQGSYEVRQGMAACGYLRPNQPQRFGFVSLQVVEGGYWTALSRFWEWFDSVGLRVPADRPDWVRDGILYSFHPGGTTGSGFTDLGGMTAATGKLLPTLPRLGVNALWILPVEYRSPYWPLDYYRFADGLGDAAQYRKLVSTAHELGFHVWQDLVPHGGAPQAVHNQAHPEFMLQREDGSHLDYWLNDFKLPAWQRYIAGVAASYMTNYGLDGFRVDACSGSKEPNWNPNVPYARASLAMMQGGLEMMSGIRAEVRRANPREGAVLAEVESTRQIAVSDVRYDFPFCYTVCRSWNRMEAGAFVTALQDYLEEQRLSEPQGAVRLRHTESHDSLRSQGWYGVQGMRAMYALSAWIDGMPMIYQGMEEGQGVALAEINRLRRERPELSRGEAYYRAVKCDVPGVFTCLRRLDERTSVVAINFNREPVSAHLRWAGGETSLKLAALEYTLWPKPEPELCSSGRETAPSSAERGQSRLTSAATGVTLSNSVPLDGAVEWFVDTLEGRLQDTPGCPRVKGAPDRGRIYWRPQGNGVLWANETTPLHPAQPRLGFKTADGRWRIYEFSGPVTNQVRLAVKADGTAGLDLLGAGGLRARLVENPALPPAPDMAAGVDLGGVRLQCVGPEYIVSNPHFQLHLLRQGGVIRQWRAGGQVLMESQDFYGDQEYFSTKEAPRMQASTDVECGNRLWVGADGLHLCFEGQIRGEYRFALKRPALWYRNEFVFSRAGQYTQRWAFRTDKAIQQRPAFLSFIANVNSAEEFQFERAGQTLGAGALVEESGRRGQTAIQPETMRFRRAGQAGWSVSGVRMAEGPGAHCFMNGHQLFFTLLDGKDGGMEAGRWYEFEATFNAPNP